MLKATGFSEYLWSVDNWGTNPNFTFGTSVVPGASSAEGSATEVLAAASVTQDIHWVEIRVQDGGTSGAQKDHLLDLGFDPAGGTSYTWFMENLPVGQSGGPNTPCPVFAFPAFIPAGSSVAVRVQGGAGTAGTVLIQVRAFGQPTRPEASRTAFRAETLGTVTASRGTTFVPGNAADGSWVSLGTLTHPAWWFLLGVQCSTATATAEYLYVDLAVGDGTTLRTIKRLFYGVAATEAVYGYNPHGNIAVHDCYAELEAGAELWIRGRCSDAPNTTYNALAIAFGG